MKLGKYPYLAIDEVVINHGYEQDAELLKNSDMDIALLDDFYIAGTSSSESSVEVVYAAGDILRIRENCISLLELFVDAANAVNKAKQFIQPDASGVAMVSSHNELFKERNKEMKEMFFPTDKMK